MRDQTGINILKILWIYDVLRREVEGPFRYTKLRYEVKVPGTLKTTLRVK